MATNIVPVLQIDYKMFILDKRVTPLSWVRRAYFFTRAIVREIGTFCSEFLIKNDIKIFFY